MGICFNNKPSFAKESIKIPIQVKDSVVTEFSDDIRKDTVEVKDLINYKLGSKSFIL